MNEGVIPAVWLGVGRHIWVRDYEGFYLLSMLCRAAGCPWMAFGILGWLHEMAFSKGGCLSTSVMCIVERPIGWRA